MPLLFSIIVVILLMGVLYWLIGTAPVIPAPFKEIAQWLVLAICVIYVVSMLLGYATPFPIFHGGYR